MPVKTISISQITDFVQNRIGKAESYSVLNYLKVLLLHIRIQSLNDKSCLEQLAAR